MYLLSTCSLFVFLVIPAFAQAAVPRAEAISGFVDDEVLAVGRIDLARFEVGKILLQLGESREGAAELVGPVSAWLGALRKAGAKEVYLVIGLSDLPPRRGSAPLVVIPLADGADAGALGKLLCGGGEVPPPYSWPTCAVTRNAVFAGSQEVLDRVPKIRVVARPELAAAFGASADAAAELVLVPGASGRRVLEEMLPNLPSEIGGGPITLITRGLLWASVALLDQPASALRVVTQARDRDSAQALRQFGVQLVDYLGKSADVARYVPDFAGLVKQLESKVVDDRIEFAIEPQQASAWVSALVKPMRENALRAQCTQNLMQIALAIHNYLASHGTFPPAFTADKAGKPLLSWRVHILPYLEQEPLYKEFHLDEPWDSEHNRPLIARMPRVFHCPSIEGPPAGPGKTTYLAPRGKDTMFPETKGLKIKDVTDGTSNTILLVDVPSDMALEWTRPDDWNVPAELDPAKALRHHPGGTNVGFADGSVRFLKGTIKAEVFKALITAHGGEVLSPDGF